LQFIDGLVVRPGVQFGQQGRIEMPEQALVLVVSPVHVQWFLKAAIVPLHGVPQTVPAVAHLNVEKVVHNQAA